MKHRNKHWLEETYWNQRLSMAKIALLAGVDKATILYWMKKKNIPRRTVSVACQGAGCSNWRGGRKHANNGYIEIYRPGHRRASAKGYVPEHRLIMENGLGRLLRREESVHHINHIPNDNRIENLRLFNSWNEHMAFHRHGEK